MAARRTTAESQPSHPALSALLSLSGSLTRTKPGGVFAEALTCVFEGTKLHAGMVHEATPSGLELVAEEGLPAALRPHVGSFPAAVAPWFVIQEAAKRRRLTVDDDAASILAARVSPSVLRSAGWNAVAAAPIVIGRDVVGVISLAASSAELFTSQVLTVLETAANMLALFLAREKALAGEVPRTERPASVTDVDEKLMRLATLGALAAGFVDDLRAVSSQLASYSSHQEKWLEQLRMRHPSAAAVLRELESAQEEAANTLMLARTSGGRLLAALEETAPELVDVGSVVHDAVGLVESAARARNVDILVAIQPGAESLVRCKRSHLWQLVHGLLADGIDACGRADKPGKPTIQAPRMQIVSVSVAREKNKIVVTIEHSGKAATTEHRRATSIHPLLAREPLGLMLARNIAASHGGTLEAARSDLGGMLVRVTLPASASPPSSKRARSGPTSSKRARMNAPTLDAMPAVQLPDTLPGSVSGGSLRPSRARAQTLPAFDEPPPVSEVDMYASTERVPLAYSAAAPARAPASIISTNVNDSPKITVVVPPSTRKRSNSGQGPASKGKGS
ncbi:MAG: HAMP domain-containing histidine kinase [Polyangiaceae bacterium]|nr:HAMP domain-containing histidine kinase [Polyangiaceae bacterium]